MSDFSLRRQARMRREYLYRKSIQDRNATMQQRKDTVKQCMQDGHEIPTVLKDKALDLLAGGDWDDAGPQLAVELGGEAAGGLTDIDDEYRWAGVEDPKVVITTSRDPSSKLKQFAKEIKLLFPNSQRLNRGNFETKQLMEACRNNDITDFIVLHETRGNPDAMLISHLPNGPTAYFNLTDVVMRHDIPNMGTMSEQFPHLIFHNFKSKLGLRTRNILKYLFPVPKDDSQRVVSFINLDDWILFRQHTFKKVNEGKDHELNEIGPRFSMKLYKIMMGTLEQEGAADIEFVLKPYLNTARKRKFLSDEDPWSRHNTGCLTSSPPPHTMSHTPEKCAPPNQSPKSSPTKKEIDAATAALNHFAQGKRHLVVGDIPSAVNSLQEACRFLAEEYGETAPECGDAYYHYGQALLELARIENGVLGNALEGEDGSTEDEEEEEDGDDDDDDDDTEAGEGDDAEAGDGDDAKAGDGEESQEEKSQNEEGNKEENGSQGEGEGEKTEEDEEEVTNLQLSWEMLELAKVIFQKQEEANPEMSKKVAQVYLKLGEVGLESENYAQGIEDFQQCLQIQERILEDDDRCLAETHYQLGVAHSFSDDFDKAIQSFNAAIKVIEQRIENLLKKIKEKESWTEEQRTKDAAVRPDPFYTEQGEIDELNQLLPEIKDKITDMEQMKNDSREKIQRAHKEALKAQAIAGKMGGSSAFGESSSSIGFDAPSSSNSGSAASAAKPITHLVRKKQRKAEDDVKEDQKKVRGENGEAVPVKSVAIKSDIQMESMVTKGDSTKKESNAVKLKENGCTKTEEKD
ncbi:hypothetical protein Pcinc_030122 [Petrolisthes cinctipes]|uniref:Brix domain-containing protein n=1 Tax=Petrolisthes cinctipes TaxID=88211 RepID=A0AAE1EZM1_PETCI|nr:hypothetical protein Pcinc_030122 [Petrolisthes cinctipes]